MPPKEKFDSVDKMTELMLIQDHGQYGRCYTITPTLKMIRKGIYKHQFSEQQSSILKGNRKVSNSKHIFS